MGLHHIGLFSRDLSATLRFYVEGLGFTQRYGWNGAMGEQGTSQFNFVLPGIMLDAGDGNYFEIFPRDPGAPETEPPFPLNHIALHTTDIEAIYKRALQHGGRPHAFQLPEKSWDGAPLAVTMHGAPERGARIAFVRGPDGELIEFFENDVL
jgi:catechol 2,3-dioxygenase-like lactoylglutathione lyase family enzyme